MSGILSALAGEDNADRAQRHKIPGLIRLPLTQIGFWPGNRGSCGICPNHVHEVANDIIVNMTKVARYGSVDIVKIPVAKLDELRALNKRMCDKSELMLMFDPHRGTSPYPRRISRSPIS